MIKRVNLSEIRKVSIAVSVNKALEFKRILKVLDLWPVKRFYIHFNSYVISS